MKTRGRPSGAKNKHYGIAVKDLCRVFNADTLIPVSKDVAKAVRLIDSSIPIQEIESNELSMPKEQPKVAFTVIEPE